MSNLFDEENAVKTGSYIQWGKEGDYVAGTVTDVKEVESTLPGKEGQMQKVYDILVEEGQYHPINEDKSIADKPVVLEKDSMIKVGEKSGMEQQLKYVKLGQKVGIKYAETKPNKKKGYNAFKLVKVYTTGEMNKDWLEAQGLNLGQL